MKNEKNSRVAYRQNGRRLFLIGQNNGVIQENKKLGSVILERFIIKMQPYRLSLGSK